MIEEKRVHTFYIVYICSDLLKASLVDLLDIWSRYKCGLWHMFLGFEAIGDMHFGVGHDRRDKMLIFLVDNIK